jgi:hypothetical protein
MSTIVYVEKVSDTERVVMERKGGSTQFPDYNPFRKFEGMPYMSLGKNTKYIFSHQIKTRNMFGIRMWHTISTEIHHSTNLVVPPYKSIIASILSRTISQVA